LSFLKCVSNPHRYGQKQGTRAGDLGVPWGVSNPHRYGQKVVRGDFAGAWEEMFQTLIGTVKSR